jgi:AAA+ superfamily predicted ATPase
MAHRDAAKATLASMASGNGGALFALTAPDVVFPGLHRSGTNRLPEWLFSITEAAKYEEARIYAVPGGCIRTEASVSGVAIGVEQGITILTSQQAAVAAGSDKPQPAGGRYASHIPKREGTGVKFHPLHGTPTDARWERLLTDLESACGLQWTGTGYKRPSAARRVIFVVDLAWLKDDGRFEREPTQLLTLKQRWFEFLKQGRSADLVWIASDASEALLPLLRPPGTVDIAGRNPLWAATFNGILQTATSVTIQAETTPWFPSRGLHSVAELLRTVPPQPPAKRVDSEIIRTIGGYQVERLAGSLNDVAGYEDIKESIRSLAERWKNPELAKSYGLSDSAGMLLFGPGGTGKTTIARAAAAELGLPFMEVKCSDFATKYINESASNLRAAFDAARSEPAIMLFFDEVDSILGQRDSSSGEDVKVINEFKAQLNKPLGAWRLVLVGATNNPWTMEAPVRQRFGEQLFIDLPDAAARAFLFRMKTPQAWLSQGVAVDNLADKTEGYSGREIAAICQKASSMAFSARTIIDDQMFERAITSTKKTVTPEEMQRHRDFAQGAP